MESIEARSGLGQPQTPRGGRLCRESKLCETVRRTRKCCIIKFRGQLEKIEMNKIVSFLMILVTVNLSLGQELTDTNAVFFGLQKTCQTKVKLENEFGGPSGFMYTAFFSNKVLVCTKESYCKKSEVPLQRRENSKYVFVYENLDLAKSVFSLFVKESEKKKPNMDFWNFVKPGKLFLLKGDTIEVYQYNSCADTAIGKAVLESISNPRRKQSYIWINCGADSRESIIVDLE